MFTENEVYFRVTYPDPDFFYPKIETFIYLGANILDSDKQTTHYFENVDMFLKNENHNTLTIFDASSEIDMINNDELYIELNKAYQRRTNKAK